MVKTGACQSCGLDDEGECAGLTKSPQKQEVPLMATNHSVEKQRAVDEARRLVQSLPIARHVFDLASSAVLEAAPDLKGQALVNRIVEIVLRDCILGNGCC
jgi:hypothetical protein